MRLLIAGVAAVILASAEPLTVPFFHQQKNGCGAASVAMVMRYWHPASPASDRIYRELYQPATKSIPLADMRAYLEREGFRAFTLKGEWRDLEEHLAKRRPIIIALKPRSSAPLHFAVVIGAESGGIWLNDPTRQKPIRVSRTRFEKQWTLASRWMLLTTPNS